MTFNFSGASTIHVNPDTDAGRKILHLLRTLNGPWAHTVHHSELISVIKQAMGEIGLYVDETAEFEIKDVMSDLTKTRGLVFCVSKKDVDDFRGAYPLVLDERNFDHLEASGERKVKSAGGVRITVTDTVRYSKALKIIKYLELHLHSQPAGVDLELMTNVVKAQCEQLVSEITGVDWTVGSWYMPMYASMPTEPVEIHLLASRKYINTTGRHYEKQTFVVRTEA